MKLFFDFAAKYAYIFNIFVEKFLSSFVFLLN